MLDIIQYVCYNEDVINERTTLMEYITLSPAQAEQLKKDNAKRNASQVIKADVKINALRSWIEQYRQGWITAEEFNNNVDLKVQAQWKR